MPRALLTMLLLLRVSTQSRNDQPVRPKININRRPSLNTNPLSRSLSFFPPRYFPSRFPNSSELPRASCLAREPHNHCNSQSEIDSPLPFPVRFFHLETISGCSCTFPSTSQSWSTRVMVDATLLSGMRVLSLRNHC